MMGPSIIQQGGGAGDGFHEAQIPGRHMMFLPSQVSDWDATIADLGLGVDGYATIEVEVNDHTLFIQEPDWMTPREFLWTIEAFIAAEFDYWPGPVTFGVFADRLYVVTSNPDEGMPTVSFLGMHLGDIAEALGLSGVSLVFVSPASIPQAITADQVVETSGNFGDETDLSTSLSMLNDKIEHVAHRIPPVETFEIPGRPATYTGSVTGLSGSTAVPGGSMDIEFWGKDGILTALFNVSPFAEDLQSLFDDYFSNEEYIDSIGFDDEGRIVFTFTEPDAFGFSVDSHVVATGTLATALGLDNGTFVPPTETQRKPAAEVIAELFARIAALESA